MYVQNGECVCDCECLVCMCMSEYACVDARVYVNCRNLLIVCFDEMFSLLPKIQH